MNVESSVLGPFTGFIPKSVRDIPKITLQLPEQIFNALYPTGLIDQTGNYTSPAEPELNQEASNRILRVNAFTTALFLTEIFLPSPSTFVATNIAACTSFPVLMTYISAKVAGVALEILTEGATLSCKAIEDSTGVLRQAKIQLLAFGVIAYLTYQATCFVLKCGKAIGDQYDSEWASKWDSTLLPELIYKKFFGSEPASA